MHLQSRFFSELDVHSANLLKTCKERWRSGEKNQEHHGAHNPGMITEKRNCSTCTAVVFFSFTKNLTIVEMANVPEIRDTQINSCTFL